MSADQLWRLINFWKTSLKPKNLHMHVNTTIAKSGLK